MPFLTYRIWLGIRLSYKEKMPEIWLYLYKMPVLIERIQSISREVFRVEK